MHMYDGCCTRARVRIINIHSGRYCIPYTLNRTLGRIIAAETVNKCGEIHAERVQYTYLRTRRRIQASVCWGFMNSCRVLVSSGMVN